MQNLFLVGCISFISLHFRSDYYIVSNLVLQGHLMIYTYTNISAEHKGRSRKELFCGKKNCFCFILFLEKCNEDGGVFESQNVGKC